MAAPPTSMARPVPIIGAMAKTAKPRPRRSGERASRSMEAVAGAETPSNNPTPARTVRSWVKLEQRPHAAVSTDQTTAEKPTMQRRQRRSARKPAGGPTRRPVTAIAAPIRTPIWPSLSLRSALMGSTSSDSACRSTAESMTTTVRTATSRHWSPAWLA